MTHEYIAETFEHKGLTVKLIQDEDAQSPYEWQDDGLFIVTTRNRYFERLHHNQDAQQVMEDKELCAKYHIFPLQMYAHSGVALSLYGGGCFSDPWDSGQVGFVFAAKSEWRYKERTTKRCVSARKAAETYVETWNQYLSGDVYGAVVEDSDGNHLDSCWGFYGLDYAWEEGKKMAEGQAESIAKTDRMEAETYAI